MLRIVIEETENYNELTNKFESVTGAVVDLEHSLLSLSKWESKYEKPFLSSKDKTSEEILGYVQAMVVTPNLDPDVLYKCSSANFEAIQEYINSSQSATTFSRLPERRGPSEVITAELIYYWMVAFNIPFECESWHLNRLFSLIQIANIKNSKGKKMPTREIAQRNRDLNAERKAKLGTSG